MPDLVPVDYDPFARFNEIGAAPFDYMAAAQKLGELAGQTWPAKLAQTFYGAVTLPGDVAAGRYASQPHQPMMWSDVDEARKQANETNYVNRGADLASLLVGGGVPTGEGVALGSGMARGARWNALSEADLYRELALRARNEGRGSTVRVFDTQAQLDKSRGLTAPERGSFDDLWAKAKAEWDNSKSAAKADFQAASNPNMTPADWDYVTRYGLGSGQRKQTGLGAVPTMIDAQGRAVDVVPMVGDQFVLPGAEQSARQVAVARGDKLQAKVPQKEPGGLFAPPDERQPSLFDPAVVDIIRKYGIAGIAALPPAVQQFFEGRIVPVDYDPFAPQTSGL